MRKLLILLSVLLLAFPVIGQERSGNIYGKVIDEEGVSLPGVKVTLSGSLTAPVTQISGINGDFRFISYPPAKDYKLTAEIEGFKTKTEEGVIITVGTNVSKTIVMEIGTLEEEIIVVAKVPVLDMKKTARTYNADSEMMQSIPSARDTLSVFEWVPGVTPNKAWVGTSNMGYQNNSQTKGGEDSYWGLYSVDGVRLEWSYSDHDMWEEIQVSVGGVNIKSRSGNLTTNMVTKRGGNDFSFGGKFFMTDDYFQGTHEDAIEREGVSGIDHIILNKEYGFNLGGPFIKDKAWFWGSYSVQDSKIINISNDPVNHILTTMNAKLNFQFIPNNRMEFWIFANEKQGIGRSASVTFPGGYKQYSSRHFGSPKGRIGIEHMFGDNLFLSLVFGAGDSGFNMRPSNNLEGELIGLHNVTTNIDMRRAEFDGDFRPRYDFYVMGNYFNDSFLGAAHEIKFGFDFERVSSKGSWARNNVIRRYNYNYPTIDITGDGIPDILSDISRLEVVRWAEQNLGRDITSGYLSDTITTGQFNIVLGLRYDTTSLFVNETEVLNSIMPDTSAWEDNFTPQTAGAIDKLIPKFTIPSIDPDYGWGYLSPRIGIIWDVGGKGRTTAKFSFGRYSAKGDLISYTKGRQYLPAGAEASLNFWWLDDSGDGIIDYTELYWHDSTTFAPYRAYDDAGNFIGDWADAQDTFWEDYDPLNPTQLAWPTRVIPDEAQRSTTATEFSFSLQHELIVDLMVALDLTYKLYDNYNWTLNYWPDTGAIDSKDNFVAVGTVPGTVAGEATGDGAGQTYYLYNESYVPTIWRIEQPRPDYNHKYYGVDFIFEKRLADNWMLGGSLTLQKDGRNYGDNGYLNPSDVWGLEGGPTSSSFPRWVGKLHGLYRLPYDTSISFMFFAREGWIVRQRLQIRDFNSPNPKSRDVWVELSKYGSNRADPFISFAIKLEKLIRIGDTGRVYLSADIFNVPNFGTTVRRYDDRIGRWFPNDDTLAPYAQRNLARQIVNPRAMRLGVRFQF